MKRVLTGLALALALFAFGGTQTATAAESQTVSGTSAWISQGQYFLTGEEEALFIGVMGGVLYLESMEGRLDSVALICPGDFVINLKTGAQSGEGKCIITDADGENVFANWDCKGEDFLGCSGQFTLTAGTGKFQGITGGSAMHARTKFTGLTVDLSSGTVIEEAAGLMTLPELTYKLP